MIPLITTGCQVPARWDRRKARWDRKLALVAAILSLGGAILEHFAAKPDKKESTPKK